MKQKIIEKRITRIMGMVDPRLTRIMWNYALYRAQVNMGYSKDSMILKDMIKDIKETIKTIGN